MTKLAEISSWEKTLLLTRSALEKKAYDLVVLEVRDFTSIADYFIVTSRPGSKENDPLKGTGVAVKKLFCYDPKQRNYRHQSGTRVYFIELTDIAISASEIRALVKQGKSIRYLVPPDVAKYIQRRRLYRGRRGKQ